MSERKLLWMAVRGEEMMTGSVQTGRGQIAEQTHIQHVPKLGSEYLNEISPDSFDMP